MRIFNLMIASCLLTSLVYGSPVVLSPKNPKTSLRQVEITTLAAYSKNHVLDLSHSNLTDSDIPAVVKYLKDHPEIISLNLEDDDLLTTPSFIAVGAVNTLKELNIGKSEYSLLEPPTILEDKDLDVFLRNSSLVSLNLNEHHISDAGAVALAKNKNLKKLFLYHTGISDRGAIELINTTEINELDLNYDIVTTATAEALARNKFLKKVTLYLEQPDLAAPFLASNATLTDLTFFGFTEQGGLTDVGALAISKNTRLDSLRIIGMKMTAKGVGYIASMKNLTKLAIDSCDCGPTATQVDDAGAQAFANNKTIRELALRYNHCTSKGIAALSQMAQLKVLNLASSWYIDDAAAIAIASNLKELQELYIGDNLLTDKAAIAFANMPNLIKLDLGLTDVQKAGAIALSLSASLRHLTLRHDDISDEGALAFANTETLKELDVSDAGLSDFAKISLKHNPHFKKLIV